MIRHEDHFQAPTRFAVRLGHNRVLVEGDSPSDAIYQARMQLSHDMPRLWDLIHAMDESKFEVERVEQARK